MEAILLGVGFVLFGALLIIKRVSLAEAALRFYAFWPGIEKYKSVYHWGFVLGGVINIAFGIFQLLTVVGIVNR